MSERSILSRGLELRPTHNLIDIGIGSALMVAVCVAVPAFAGDVLPSGGTVTAGSASIVRTNPSTLNINQGTNQAIINWNSFSVGRGDTVNFNQPGTSSATLNRVTGSTPSWIAGTINAPGTVLLVNPNGIAITKSGTVNTGSFVGSTLDIKDADFLAGHYKFGGNGASAGVINNGHINVSDGGFAALLGGQVSNNGVIAARLGKVGLGAGEQATLDLSGDGFLSVTVPSSELGHMTRADGALISNKGKINADGGTVFLSAATASNILRNAVNMGGTIHANSVGMHDGRIVINGGGGNVNVTGKLLAKSRKGKGGEVDITSAGAAVKLVGALIDVSGKTGGGVVNIGGGPHATVALDEAGSVSIDSATTIRADAMDSGDGGHIVIWSGGQTTAHGTFSAKGGRNGGNGGLVETSGHSVDLHDIAVNTSAVKGTAGTWLIDPTNLTIDQNTAYAIRDALNGGSAVTLTTNFDGTTTTGFGSTSSGAGDIIFNGIINSSGSYTSLLTVNALNDVIFNAGGGIITTGSFTAVAGGSFRQNVGSALQVLETTAITAQGDIALAAPVLSVGSTVGGTTLTAAGNINIAAYTGSSLGITPTLSAGGNIQVTSGVAGSSLATQGGAAFNAGGDVDIGASITNSAGHFGIGLVTLRADSYGTGIGTVNFSNGAQIVSSGPTNILYNPSSYASPTDYRPDVTAPNQLGAYMLVNSLANLQAINTNLSGSYALGKDIDAGGANFAPIGLTSNNTASAFTGTFDGQSHVISNLNIVAPGFYSGDNQGNSYGTGVFEINSGTIRNVGLVNGSVRDDYNDEVGSLVSWNRGSVSNSFSTLSVSSQGTQRFVRIGGLVGLNSGTISGGSYATGTITATGDDAIAGGLVGANKGTIQDSYATGDVTANGGIAGGLVGENVYQAHINRTYALGDVHGGNYTGGLAGQNDWSNIDGAAAIYNSYAAGHLSGGTIGGLVGNNEYDNQGTFVNGGNQSAIVYWSIWDRDTTGTLNPFGDSYFNLPGGSSTAVQYIGFVSTSPSPGTSPSGAGYLGSPYSKTSYNVFYDTTPFDSDFALTNGDTIHVSGTTAASSFAQYWYIVDGSTRPFLAAEASTTIQNAHQLQLIDKSYNSTYTLARDISYTNDGMWTSAGFSPIAPVNEVDNPLPGYATGFNCGGCQTVNPVNMTYDYEAAATAFTGVLNGNGHTISNLYVNTTGSAGLFDTIGAYNLPGQGAVENLGIVNSTFATSAGLYAGTIAGLNYGQIISSWAVSTSVNGRYYSGGLVGANNGGATISQSHASVTVIGLDQTGATTFDDKDGGLAGFNGGTIMNSYATGKVFGNGYVGGLVGYNSFGVVYDSYATTQLFADWNFGIASAGPLIGYNNFGAAISSIWNSDSWSASQAGINAGAPYWFSPSATVMLGTGLSTAQMQDLNAFKTNYAGWDFNRIWAPPNQAGQGGQSVAYYPDLYSTSNIVVLGVRDATQQYGGTSAALTGGLYSLGDAGRLASYSIGPLSSSATTNSSVGTYSIGLQPANLATGVGRVVPSFAGTPAFYETINGVDIQLGPQSSMANLIYGINLFTALTGVTASSDAGGHLVLTAARNISVSPDFSGFDPYGIAGAYSYTPPGTATASMLNGSTPRMLVLPGTLTVTPALLTITANDATKTYGQAISGSTTGYSVSGLVNSDNISSVSLNSAGFAAGAGVNGGVPYAITASNASGTGLGNYTITYVNGGVTVQPAALTYTANSASMTYGGSVPTLSGTVTGFVGSDSLATTTTGSATFTTLATSLSNAGTYAITGGGLTLTNPNYTFVQAASNATALTINKAVLTVTGDKAYDATTGFTTAQLAVAGGVNGQTIALTAGGGTSGGGNVGIYTGSPLSGLTIRVSGGNGNDLASNYQLPATGTLTIDKAALTLAGSRTYDGTTVFSASAFGNGGTIATGINGETLILTGSGSVLSANVSAGTQTLALGSFQFTNGTGLAANYVIAANNNTATVNPATLSLAGVRNYDGTTIFSASTFGNNGTISTGINGEALAVIGTGSVASPNVIAGTQGLALGSLQLTDGSGLAGNYVIAASNSTGTINPAPVTVTANGGVSTYGGSPTDPGLSAIGLQHGESVNVLTGLANSFAITSTTNAGTYTLTVLGKLSNPNYSVTTNTGTWTVNPAQLTLAGFKTYDGTTTFLASAFGTNGTIDGVNGEKLTLTGSGSVLSPNVSAGTQGLGLETLQITNGTGLASNYVFAANGNTGTINPASVTVTANGGSSIYGGSPVNPGLSATGLQRGEGVDVLTGLLNSFGITNLTNTGSYKLAVTGELTNSNYVVNTTNSGRWTVTPATLTYVADPSTQFAGSTFSAFTGTVIGFVNGQNLASATTGTAQFDTPATAASTPGRYGIFGSGLIAKFGNYVFAQAPGNATALTLNPAPTTPPSQSQPSSPGTPTSPQVGINFQNPNTSASVTRVSFTPSSRPGTNTASNQTGNNDVNTTSLTAGDKFMHNGGRYFPPISQYDPEQYSDFKLPKFAPSDSQATVLTILARGIAQANAAKYMIDGFWNGDGSTSPGEGNTWPGPGHIDLLDKATFSDGAGHDATPTNDPAFPIAAGKTDFAALLNNGPVMIGAPSDPHPVQWLLATSMAPDGKGIICDDTMTGKLVELAFDPATKALGGITRLFDEKSNSFVPLADASNDIPASDTGGLSGLQSFVPSTYFAVTVH